MPAELFKRVNLDFLYPPFLEMALELVARCARRGPMYFATRGFATYDEQMKLWLQGRTLAGKIVTNAKGGQSAHNFGIALDFTHDNSPAPGLQPDWNPAHYQVLIDEAQKAGLQSGAVYNDRPHVSWPGFVSAHDLLPLDRIFQGAAGESIDKLRAVWKHLDSFKKG